MSSVPSRRRLSILVLPLLVVALLLSACGAQPGAAGSQANARVRAVTSTSVFVDFIHQVGGDRVAARNIVPTGGDVHSFQPSPQDVRALAEANIVFLNGRGLDQTVEQMARQNPAPVWILTEGITTTVEDDALLVGGDEHTPDDGHDHGDEAGGNPHLWLDPRLAKQYVERIRDGLSAVDPDGAATYAANAQAYLARLDALDAEVEQTLSVIPPDRRHFVTYHDAFPYFARRYNLEVLGVVVRNPGSEPSADDIARLVETLRQRGVRTVFKEPQINARILELAAKDLGIQVSEIYSDALTDQVKTYEDMMRINAQRVADGLR